MAAPTDSVEIGAMTDDVAAQLTDVLPAKRGAGNVWLSLTYIKNLILSGLTLAWGSITGTPTTLAGYGITDAAPSSHVGSGGTQHANAVAAGAAGFMTGADKTKLDGIAAGAQPGTVTSVAMTVPADMAVSGSPITGSGTLALTRNNQNANLIFAGPASGAAAAPTFRALTPADGAALPYTRLKVAGTVQIGVPNLGILGTATRTLTANRLYLEPFPVYETLTIDTIQFEVTTAGAAGKLARVGIYAIDQDASPQAVIVDAGTALVDSTGIRTVTLGTPQVLTPGWYAFALVSDGVPALRVQRYANPATGANNAWSATAGLSVYYANFTFGALTAAPALTGVITAASGYEHSMQCSVSTP